MKFYLCNHCKNLVEMVMDSGVNPVCCGEKMQELKANTTDAVQEKHVPVVNVSGNVVNVVVGSVLHPQTEAHLINFIVLKTCCKVYRKDLTKDDEPKASFVLEDGEKPLEVYAYCNLHGLWKASL